MTVDQQAFGRVAVRMSALINYGEMDVPLHHAEPIADIVARLSQVTSRDQPAYGYPDFK